MSEGGISAGQVRSIVDREVDPLRSDIRSLSSEISGLRSEIGGIHRMLSDHDGRLRDHDGRLRDHANRIRELEDELGKISTAIDRMSEHLSSSLDRVVVEQRATCVATVERVEATNQSLRLLRSESSQGFTLVSGDMKQLTRANVQIEVIRVLNEARDPVQRVLAFSEEIDQRFAKAVESVALVRSEYDHLQAVTGAEYAKKLRTIGDHIYSIYEKDFREHAELPLSQPSNAFQDLVQDVEDRKLEARSLALNADLEALGRETLEPLLNAHHEFEQEMSSRFAERNLVLGTGEEVGVPIAIRLWSDPSRSCEVFAGATLHQESGAQGREGLHFAIQRDPSIEPWVAEVTRKANAMLPQVAARKLSPAEVDALKVSLRNLSDRGAFDPALLNGYFEYIDSFGLELIDQGQWTFSEGGAR